MSAHNFTIGSAINQSQQPLTLDALRGYAPSAFEFAKTAALEMKLLGDAVQS